MAILSVAHPACCCSRSTAGIASSGSMSRGRSRGRRMRSVPADRVTLLYSFLPLLFLTNFQRLTLASAPGFSPNSTTNFHVSVPASAECSTLHPTVWSNCLRRSLGVGHLLQVSVHVVAHLNPKLLHQHRQHVLVASKPTSVPGIA
eukprot:3940917-Rhodomonas_salina.5